MLDTLSDSFALLVNRRRELSATSLNNLVVAFVRMREYVWYGLFKLVLHGLQSFVALLRRLRGSLKFHKAFNVFNTLVYR